MSVALDGEELDGTWDLVPPLPARTMSLPSIVITPPSPIISRETPPNGTLDGGMDENLNINDVNLIPLPSPPSPPIVTVEAPTPSTNAINPSSKENSPQNTTEATSSGKRRVQEPAFDKETIHRRKRYRASYYRRSSSESSSRSQNETKKLKKKGNLGSKAIGLQRRRDKARQKKQLCKSPVDHTSFKNLRLYLLQFLKFGGKGQANAEKIANHAIKSIRCQTQACNEDLRNKFVSDFRRGSNGLLMFKEALALYLASMKAKNRFKCVEGIANFFFQDDETWQLIEKDDTVKLMSASQDLSQFLKDSREKYHRLRDTGLHLSPRMLSQSSPAASISPHTLEKSKPNAKRKRSSKSIHNEKLDIKTNNEVALDKSESSESNTLDVMMTFGRLPQDLKNYLDGIGLPSAKIIGDIIPTIILAISDKCQMSYEDLRDLYIHTMSELALKSEPNPPDQEFRLRLSWALGCQDFFEFVTSQVTLSMVTEVISRHFKYDANTQELLQVYNEQQKHVSKLLAQRANVWSFISNFGC